MSASVKKLTANVDLQLAEVCEIILRARELCDEVSVCSHVARTRQVDRGPGCNGARVLTANGVVPQCRRRDGRRDIGQTDDEIVRSPL